jgi:xanthine/uracil/vitamin C permease (AzgA family)
MWFYLLAWLPMVVIAIANGTLRDLWYAHYTGALAAHQISTVTLILLFALYIRIVIRRRPPRSASQAWAVGLLWLTLTLAFELGFGHYVAGHPWRELLADYDLTAGRLWVLIPTWVTLAPFLFYRLQR